MEDYGKHGDHVGLLGTEAVKSGASLRWPLEQSRLTTSEIILFQKCNHCEVLRTNTCCSLERKGGLVTVITQDFLQF